MKKILFGALALIMGLSIFTSCGERNVEQKVTGISFRQGTEMVLATDESERLTVIFEPEGTTSLLTWETSDTLVVEVSNNGTVTGIYPGDAYVTATCEDGETKASIHITVKEYLKTVQFTQAALYSLDTLGYGGEVITVKRESGDFKAYKAKCVFNIFTEGLYINDGGDYSGSTQGAFIQVEVPVYYATAYLTGSDGGTIYSLGEYLIEQNNDTTPHKANPGTVDEEKYIAAMQGWIDKWKLAVDAETEDDFYQYRSDAYDYIDSASQYVTGTTMRVMTYHSTEEGYSADGYYLNRGYTGIVTDGDFYLNKTTNVSQYMYGMDYAFFTVKFFDMFWGCNWQQDSNYYMNWVDKNLHYDTYEYAYGTKTEEAKPAEPIHNPQFLIDMPMVEYIMMHPAKTNIIMPKK